MPYNLNPKSQALNLNLRVELELVGRRGFER